MLSEGDPGLLNVYHVIEITTEAGDRVQPDGAVAFADWITSPPAQQQIGEFGVAEFGQPLFTPDAGKDEAALAWVPWISDALFAPRWPLPGGAAGTVERVLSTRPAGWL